MARILGLLPAALIAAKEGMSARAFGRLMRELGEGARSSEMDKMYGLAKQMIATSGDEIFRNISLAPLPSEMTPWTSKGATGVRQNVSVIIRERSTGNIRSVPYSAYSATGTTREEAMASALSSYSTNNEAYNTEIIGAVHGATYQYTPSGL